MPSLNTIGLSSFPVMAVSNEITSQFNISGLHFATMQSEGVELVTDWNFLQDYYSTDTWGSTSSIWKVGSATPTYDSINKGINVVTSAANQGLATPIANISSRGACWASVDITGVSMLPASTLILEIVDYNSTGPVTTVVASKSFTVSNGKSVDVSLGYWLRSNLYPVHQMYAQVIDPVGGNTFQVNAISFIDESICWQFSNDGGSNWHEAFNIRNNTYGILTFPALGTELLWQAIAYRPNLFINAIRIRPVFEGTPNLRNKGRVVGPNDNIEDFAPHIEQDPFFSPGAIPALNTWNATKGRYSHVPTT